MQRVQGPHGSLVTLPEDLARYLVERGDAIYAPVSPEPAELEVAAEPEAKPKKKAVKKARADK